MSGSGQAETPGEILARRIVARLVAEGLIGEQAAEEIRTGLASGKLRGEDWRLPLELGAEREDER